MSKPTFHSLAIIYFELVIQFFAFVCTSALLFISDDNLDKVQTF